MLRGAGKTKEASDKFCAWLSASTILSRLGRPTDIAKAALFLASDDSSYVTGIELFIDDGLSQI
jgi:NAD(P)-dependent dehydrogenase (short-subunit alcohol dehydrogenase family)